MSSGTFSKTKYESDSGTIHPIRVQPETVGITVGGGTNAAPAGALDSPISAKVSAGNRAFGLKARSITIAFLDTAPTGYKVGSYIRLPILTPTRYSGVAAGQTFSYLGQTATVIGKNPERVR